MIKSFFRPDRTLLSPDELPRGSPSSKTTASLTLSGMGSYPTPSPIPVRKIHTYENEGRLELTSCISLVQPILDNWWRRLEKLASSCQRDIREPRPGVKLPGGLLSTLCFSDDPPARPSPSRSPCLSWSRGRRHRTAIRPLPPSPSPFPPSPLCSHLHPPARLAGLQIFPPSPHQPCLPLLSPCPRSPKTHSVVLSPRQSSRNWRYRHGLERE